MFPVADNQLSIGQIADFWASELVLGDAKLRDRREIEIRDLLVRAFWLGDLVGIGSWTRLSFLKTLYRAWNDEITFRLPGKFQKSIHQHNGGSRIWISDNEPTAEQHL